MQENHPLFANTQTVIVAQLLRGDITMIARVVPIALVIIFTLALLAGCTQNETIETSKPPAEKLVVYSSHPLSILKPLLTQFEGETDIAVEVVRGGSGELMDRLEAEKDAPVCDVLWGGMLSTVNDRNYLFEDYVCQNDEAMQPEFRQAAVGATLFSDLPAVLMVNHDKYQGSPIKGYEDLLRPELKGRIAMGDPGKSSAAYAHLVSMLYAMGKGNPEDGWDYVDAFCAQIGGSPISSSTEVYKSVINTGPMAVSLTFEEAAAKYVSEGSPVDLIYPQEGLVSDQDGIFIIKGTAKRELAEKLLNFLTGPSAQRQLSEQLYRRPVRLDLPLSPLSPLPPKEKLPLIRPDRELISASRQGWINRFHALCQKYYTEE